jgi:hypothetical protein
MSPDMAISTSDGLPHSSSVIGSASMAGNFMPPSSAITATCVAATTRISGGARSGAGSDSRCRSNRHRGTRTHAPLRCFQRTAGCGWTLRCVCTTCGDDRSRGCTRLAKSSADSTEPGT